MVKKIFEAEARVGGILCGGKYNKEKESFIFHCGKGRIETKGFTDLSILDDSFYSFPEWDAKDDPALLQEGLNMIVTNEINVEYFVINDGPMIDPITVILKDNGNQSGKIIVECYGEAWTNYFSSFGSKTLRSFISKLTPEYLTEKLDSVLYHRPVKKDLDYLFRISKTVISACRLLEA